MTDRLLDAVLFNTKWITIYYVGMVVLFSGIWWLMREWRAAPLQEKVSSKRQVFKEMRTMAFALPVLGSFIPLVLVLGLAPHVNLRRPPLEHGWGWLVASFLLMIVVQDTWFYWSHRLMHVRGWYRWIHLRHHRSVSVNPWSTYSISMAEALVDSMSALFILLLIPASGITLLAFTVFNSAYAVYGHLGYELFPRRFLAGPVGRWINTSTAHQAHHAKVRYNFGWYFLFWDRAMGTLDPEYDRIIASGTPSRSSSQSVLSPLP
ncbi:MAG: sterol desaturase family protein [Telluria sp.]